MSTIVPRVDSGRLRIFGLAAFAFRTFRNH
jgi:hypothetical protein